MGYAFNIILVQGFCPLKIKFTQFPGGFRLNSLGFVTHSYPQSSFIRDDFCGAKRTSAWEATGSLIKLNAFQTKGKFCLNLEILEAFSMGLEVSFWGDFCISEPQILFCFVFLLIGLKVSNLLVFFFNFYLVFRS